MMSPLHRCFLVSNEPTDTGARLEIRAKRKKAKRKAHENTKSLRQEGRAHLSNARSNSGETGGACEGACFMSRSRPHKVSLSSSSS